MCTNDKGKQINKQQGVAHVGVQMQGAVQLLCNLWSLLCNASEYMEGLQRCSEEHRVQYARSYSDTSLPAHWGPLCYHHAVPHQHATSFWAEVELFQKLIV